jgi:hypothetical protein
MTRAVHSDPPQCEISIQLQNEDVNQTASYPTLDEIRGEVVVVAKLDMELQAVQVTFEGKLYESPFPGKRIKNLFSGTCTTNILGPDPSGMLLHHSSSSHTFLTLQLREPSTEDCCHDSTLLKAHESHRIPFVFVLPASLLPHACSHDTAHDDIHRFHLLLPPSFKIDGDSANFDCPQSVIYEIEASIASGDRDHSQSSILVRRQVCIIPAVCETLTQTMSLNEDTVIKTEGVLRNGVLRKQYGRLEAANPRTDHLSITEIASLPKDDIVRSYDSPPEI